MAIIRYKCTVCKREIDLPENQKGLEVMNRCVITEGCRGELYRLTRKQDFIRGDFPPRVPGLTDYTPRRVLYNHDQAVGAREWFVEHNLGVAPAVEVLVDRVTDSGESFTSTPCAVRDTDSSTTSLIETTDFQVTITGPNTLTITFDDPESGLAQCIARSSAPVVVEEEVVTEAAATQLTATGSFLTVATRNDTITSGSSVDFEVKYTAPGSTTPTTVTYTAPPTTSSDSPWNDFDNVQIAGKTYQVRSFDAFVSGMSDGTIPDGSSFYFNRINDGGLRTIQSGEVIILLALDPYANVDKVQDRIIDVSRVTSENAALSLFHSDRELFAFTSIITSTFPPIREV